MHKSFFFKPNEMDEFDMQEFQFLVKIPTLKKPLQNTYNLHAWYRNLGRRQDIKLPFTFLKRPGNKLPSR